MFLRNTKKPKFKNGDYTNEKNVGDYIKEINVGDYIKEKDVVKSSLFSSLAF